MPPKSSTDKLRFLEELGICNGLRFAWYRPFSAMRKETILLVEDDEAIQELVRYHLCREGYQVSSACLAAEALKLVNNEPPDLILLDLMLPDLDGLSLCKVLRSQSATREIPIVMLTAKGAESDTVAGLEVGADDYIVKPFSPRVLIARLRAVLRRQGPAEESAGLQFGDLFLHPGQHEVRVGDDRIELTHTQFRILQLLMQRPGWVFTRYQIVEAIQGQGYAVTERTVDVQMVALRKKLGSASRYLSTVRGVGYRLKET